MLDPNEGDLPMSGIDQTPINNPDETRQSGDTLDWSKLSADQIIRRGQDAWVRVRGDHTWADWLEIGAALCVGRTEAMYVAQTNKPVGRNYNTAFAAWLKEHGFDAIDQGDRARLFKVMEHRDQIEKWRTTLPLNQRLALNHPSSVLRKWKANTVVPDPNAPKKLSPVAKLNDVVARLEEENHRMRKEIERAGGDLWTPDDTPEDIATVMLVKLTPTKAERIARAILKLTNKKSASAPAPRTGPPKRAKHPTNKAIEWFFKGYQKLDQSALENRILQIQRVSTHQHPTEHQWRTLDRMRKRAADLKKTANSAVQPITTELGGAA
jgi:hypothetical protein